MWGGGGGGGGGGGRRTRSRSRREGIRKQRRENSSCPLRFSNYRWYYIGFHYKFPEASTFSYKIALQQSTVLLAHVSLDTNLWPFEWLAVSTYWKNDTKINAEIILFSDLKWTVSRPVANVRVVSVEMFAHGPKLHWTYLPRFYSLIFYRNRTVLQVSIATPSANPNNMRSKVSCNEALSIIILVVGTSHTYLWPSSLICWNIGCLYLMVLFSSTHCGLQCQIVNVDCSGSSPFNGIILALSAVSEENIDLTS